MNADTADLADGRRLHDFFYLYSLLNDITDMVIRRLATMLLLFILPLIAAAQEWEVGLQGGASGYMGDLNPENPLAFNDWAAGVSVKYNLNHTWGIRGNFAYANTFAHDQYSRVQQRQERNLAFFGAIKEAAILVDFNFFKWLPQRGRIVYTPYIFAGVGAITFDPTWYAPGSSEKVRLRDMRTEYHVTDNPDQYEKHAYSIPFGAGFKYNLRGPWSVGIELGYRLTLTDYLDDVSGYYPQTTPPPPFLNDPYDRSSRYTVAQWQYLAYRDSPTATPGTQRGDGRPYDSFMTVGVTLSYTIFKGGCPEWQF